MRPSQDEINEVLGKAAEAENEGTTRWIGMSYEMGVRAAIEWMLDSSMGNPLEGNPLEDDDEEDDE